jgi:hypothetical protein
MYTQYNTKQLLQPRYKIIFQNAANNNVLYFLIKQRYAMRFFVITALFNKTCFKYFVRFFCHFNGQFFYCYIEENKIDEGTN